MFLSSPQIIPLQKVAKYSYAQLILYGLNYSFKKIRNRKILLNLHYSYVFGFKLPPTIIGRVYKRRFVIFGEKLFLLQFIKELVQLRKGNIYTGKGFRLRTLPYRVKPGKVKRR